MKVAELIAKLQEFPPEATVVIEDADTLWALNLQRVEAGVDRWSGAVVLAGDYGDEWSTEDQK